MSNAAMKARRLEFSQGDENRNSKGLLGYEKDSSAAANGCRTSVSQDHHRRKLSFSISNHQDAEQFLTASTSSLIDIICSSNYEDDIIDTWNEVSSPATGNSLDPTLLPPSTAAPNDPLQLLQAAEIAANMLLGREVLLPVMRDYCDYVPRDLQSELPEIFASYSQGRTGYLTASPALCRIGVVVVEASIEAIDPTDVKCVENWWEHDKALSYASNEWNDWWNQSCARVESGCEMVKLVVSRDHYCTMEGHETVLVLQKGTILGIAYFARRVNDPRYRNNRGVAPPTLSMIRGIRVAPQYNPEILQRLNLNSDVKTPYHNDACIRGIASALLCHVLFASMRHSNRGVGVVALKNEQAQRFYQTYLGLSVGVEGDGKRFYRAMESHVWVVLRHAFARHINMWMRALQPSSKQQQQQRGSRRVLRELVPTQVSSIQDQQQRTRGKRMLPNETFSGIEIGWPKSRSFKFLSENRVPDEAVSSPLESEASPVKSKADGPTPDIVRPSAIFYWAGGKKQIQEEDDDDDDDDEQDEGNVADDGGSVNGRVSRA